MMTKHHRRPVSKGGTSEPRNVSMVHSKSHKAWHLLFQNLTPYQIANTINDTWIDPDYEFVVRRKADVRLLDAMAGDPFYHFEDAPDPEFNE